MNSELLKKVDEVLEKKPAVKEVRRKKHEEGHICNKCGNPAIKGRVGKDEKGEYFPDWECQTCRAAAKDLRDVYPADLLLKEVKRLNAKNTAFEDAKRLWKAVADGKAKPLTVDEKEVSHFAVIKMNGNYSVIGISRFHAAAIAKAGLHDRITVKKDRETASKEAKRLAERAQRFAERKREWQEIDEHKRRFFGPEKKAGECEFPTCNRKAGEDATGVVDGEVVNLCPFCGAALLTMKRRGQCKKFAYFKGKDALERAKRFLQWYKKREELHHKISLKQLKLVK